MPSLSGNLEWKPLADHLHEVAKPVALAAERVPSAHVAVIDPHCYETAALCTEYDVDPDVLTTCVLVCGELESGDKTYAAVLVRHGDKVDLNGVVRRRLGVRRVSFADQDVSERATGMIRSCISPVGLPDDWHLLIDDGITTRSHVVVAAGVRGAKILTDVRELTALPHAEVLDLAASTE